MKRKHLLTLAILGIGFSSCQKESSSTLPSRNTSPSTTMKTSTKGDIACIVDQKFGTRCAETNCGCTVSNTDCKASSANSVTNRVDLINGINVFANKDAMEFYNNGWVDKNNYVCKFMTSYNLILSVINSMAPVPGEPPIPQPAPVLPQ